MTSTVESSLVSSVSSTSSGSTTTSNDITQQEFLEIMLAQLANQDPNDPADTAELVSQMTNYSMLASMQSIESLISSLSDSLLSNQIMESSSLLGHQVELYSSTGELSGDTPLTGSVELSDAVEDLTITIYDSNGEEVQTLELGDYSAGEVEFSWDGATGDGQADAGIYSVIATGTVDGEAQALTTRTMLTVESVGFNGDSSVYLSDGSEISTTDILQVA